MPGTGYTSGSQSVVPGPVASVLFGNFLEMKILGPHTRPDKSEILEVRHIICILINPPITSNAD